MPARAPGYPAPVASPDPLTRALLPVLLHKLSNATQLLTGLNAALALEGGGELLAERSDDLAATSRGVEELGWVLAVLGSAGGANLLLARREPRGLAILVPLVVDAARRADAALAPPSHALPALAPDALDGWQVPWALGSLLFAAAEDAGGATAGWSLDSDGGSWRLTLEGGEGTAACARRVLEHLPGAELEGDGTSIVLRLPGPWLVVDRRG